MQNSTKSYVTSFFFYCLTNSHLNNNTASVADNGSICNLSNTIFRALGISILRSYESYQMLI